MMPMNNVQLAVLMQMQQMQQMQQIQQILHSTIPLNPQQQMQLNDNDNDEDDEILRSLFVANLDERVDEEILYELFLQAGPLEFVRLPKQRTFAFITYAHACSPAYAMNLFQGVTLYGKPLVIKYQGKTAVPPLIRRLLPPDWGLIDKSMQQGLMDRHFDNSSLRGAYYNPFTNDSGRSDLHRNNNRNKSPNRYSSPHSRDLSPHGRRGRERLHNSSGPYERRRDNSRERDRESDRGRDRDRDRNYDRRNNSHRYAEKGRSNHI